ncbi:MAG: hypothetical protein KGQ44_06160, partial [Betaproteobacteria bacterium]|nr:hypothetical protein [Betaproteobacteria bacterium]
MSKSVRISSLILAFAAMALGTHMAQAQPFDAKQQANQYEYNERVQFRQPDQPRYITNDLIKVLYEQSIQEVITESKQLALLHSVYQNDLAHNAQDQ